MMRQSDGHLIDGNGPTN